MKLKDIYVGDSTKVLDIVNKAVHTGVWVAVEPRPKDTFAVLVKQEVCQEQCKGLIDNY